MGLKPKVQRVSHASQRLLHLDPIIFGYPDTLQKGVVPRSLAFPSEWYYGFVRSDRGAEILIQRSREYPHAWCVASYAVSEFVMRGFAVLVEPTDMVVFQEIVWATKPDLIIETGIAHGGSLIMSASLLAMLDYSEAVETGGVVDPKTAKRRVLGIDIDIRPHNREAIEAHPISSKIDMFEGSSIEDAMIQRVAEYAGNYERVLVCLDSNHTHDHVLAELNAYAGLATKDSYCLVFDTVIEDLPAGTFPDRPWAPGNNAKTAVHEFLKSHPEFSIDQSINNKLLISAAPDGWLKRVK